MTDAERMIDGYSGIYYERALQIARNIIEIEKAINKNIDEIRVQPLYIVEIAGERAPHEVTKENPAWIGFRNMVKTHADLVATLRKLIGDSYGGTGQDDGWEQLFNEVRSK